MNPKIVVLSCHAKERVIKSRHELLINYQQTLPLTLQYALSPFGGLRKNSCLKSLATLRKSGWVIFEVMVGSLDHLFPILLSSSY